MKAIFGQRQRLRRFASGMLLVWLFALSAGVVNACVVAPELARQETVAAASHQHDATPGHHQETSAGAAEPQDKAPAVGAAACTRFCAEPAASATASKQPVEDMVPVLWLPAIMLSPVWTGHTSAPAIHAFDARPWPPGPTVPVRIAFVRQAL